MDINTIIEEVLRSEDFKVSLREQLSFKIAKEYTYHDVEGVMIRDEVREILKQEAQTLAHDFFENYFEATELKTLIEREIGKLTKAEILKVLAS